MRMLCIVVSSGILMLWVYAYEHRGAGRWPDEVEELNELVGRLAGEDCPDPGDFLLALTVKPWPEGCPLPVLPREEAMR